MSFSTSGSSSSQRSLSNATKEVGNAFNRLSSGKRINNASDDAAGQAVVAQLIADGLVLGKAVDNAEYSKLALNNQDAAIESISGISSRLAELSTQSANGTLSDGQRGALNDEYQALSQEAKRIAATSEFNGNKTFNGSGSTAQVGKGSGENDRLAIPSADAAGFTAALAGLDISSLSGARAAIDAVASISGDLSQARGLTGAAINRLTVAAENAKTEQLATKQAASIIQDADIGEESARLTQAKIKQETAIASIQRTNQASQGVLRLLA